jgi:hypothetical protein
VARSIFLEIFRVFGGFLHQGRNIELDSLQEGATWIRVSAVWRGRLWHLDFRLQGGLLLAPIYLSVEFSTIWRSPSAGPKSWSSHLFSRTCHQPGGFGRDPGSSCIDLHCISSLWRLALSYQEHFVAAHILSLGAI